MSFHPLPFPVDRLARKKRLFRAETSPQKLGTRAGKIQNKNPSTESFGNKILTSARKWLVFHADIFYLDNLSPDDQPQNELA
ncbi:MAG: hypothetical protein Q4B13_04435 [Lautropia sp.]|nr:hypothetical protein [Lautropia sp.]